MKPVSFRDGERKVDEIVLNSSPAPKRASEDGKALTLKTTYQVADGKAMRLGYSAEFRRGYEIALSPKQTYLRT
jgi:hypothetical protein